MADHPAAELLRDWFNRGQSGCKFASRLASADPRLEFVVHLEPVTAVNLDALDRRFESAATRKDVCLLVFPRVSSDREIVELAMHLRQSSRWSIGTRRHPKNAAVLGLSIEYRTANGSLSAAMGFAPSPTMPVTRRAPYTALALWTGERENEFFPHSPAGLVNMADVPTGLPRESHEKTWTASVDGTKVRLQDPFYSSVWLRKVAFCLASELVEPLIEPHSPT